METIMNRETTCSFTGHRNIALANIKNLEFSLETAVSALIDQGFTEFFSGGALGFDQLAARTVLKLKKTCPDVRLSMILPCKNQDKFWSAQEKENYRELLFLSDKIVYTSEGYHKGCMQKRNRYLVDSAGCILAYLNHATGGTKYTVNYAEETGVPVLFLEQNFPYQLSFL